VTGKFQQLHLGDMERGLAKELAVYALSPPEITELIGVKFEITQDNLDYCKAALLATADGQQFALRSYFRGPRPDVTELIGSERSLQPEADLKKFLNALELPKESVLWSVGSD
jgi:hypothetical protein